MDLIGVLAHHGCLATAAVLFLAAIGLPLPVSVTLLAAGASSHGDLGLGEVLAAAVLAALCGDLLLYFGGRYTGWWLLSWLCRISINPEACIFTSAEYFYRRGSKTLLFARFLPGLGALAAPLAGSLQMRFMRFLRFSLTGTVLYCLLWAGIGFAFSKSIREIIGWLEGAGHVLLTAVLFLVLVYIVLLIVMTLRAQRKKIERISASELQHRMQTATPNRLVIIADVRSHGYYDPGMQRIKNSIRVEPHRLKEELDALREFMAPECEVYLYCSCIRDTTSVRIAHRLQQENCKALVIEGGIKAWVKAGGALEPIPTSDIQHLPRFE